MPDSVVAVDGVVVERHQGSVYIMFNKPPGIVSTASKKDPNNMIDHVGYPERIYPVGRLDKASRGLILLTNDGELAYKLTRTAEGHEKEYRVIVDHDITEDFLAKMRAGVFLPELNKTTISCRVKKESARCFSIVLVQGLNRQIRRMCHELGYEVCDLFRVRINDLQLGDLGEGCWRELSDIEVEHLWKTISNE
jgi:23S rRNA pseudouridine2604 synthase